MADHLKCWYSFESYNPDAEGLNIHRRQQKRQASMARLLNIWRSPQAVACRKRYVGEPRKPHEFLYEDEQ